MNARVIGRAWVAVLRPFRTAYAKECDYCGGTGSVLSPHQATCEDGIPDTDVCPQCRGEKSLVWCDECLRATDSYELGDECRATRVVEVPIDAHSVARRQCCGQLGCMPAAIDAACNEAERVEAHRAAMRAANKLDECRHENVPFDCRECEDEFNARVIAQALAEQREAG